MSTVMYEDVSSADTMSGWLLLTVPFIENTLALFYIMLHCKLLFRVFRLTHMNVGRVFRVNMD